MLATILIGGLVLLAIVSAAVYTIKNKDKCAGCASDCHCKDKSRCGTK